MISINKSILSGTDVREKLDNKIHLRNLNGKSPFSYANSLKHGHCCNKSCNSSNQKTALTEELIHSKVF